MSHRIKTYLSKEVNTDDDNYFIINLAAMNIRTNLKLNHTALQIVFICFYLTTDTCNSNLTELVLF